MSFFFSGVIYFKREKKKKTQKTAKIYKLKYLILKLFPDEELPVLK